MNVYNYRLYIPRNFSFTRSLLYLPSYVLIVMSQLCVHLHARVPIADSCTHANIYSLLCFVV